MHTQAFVPSVICWEPTVCHTHCAKGQSSWLQETHSLMRELDLSAQYGERAQGTEEGETLQYPGVMCWRGDCDSRLGFDNKWTICQLERDRSWVFSTCFLWALSVPWWNIRTSSSDRHRDRVPWEVMMVTSAQNLRGFKHWKCPVPQLPSCSRLIPLWKKWKWDS